MRAWIFLGPIFNYQFSSVLSCEDLLNSFLQRSANIWISYIENHYSSLGWFIWTQHILQLPVGLLAQLVQRCTGIAEVMGSNPLRAWNFFQVLFTTTRFRSVLSCEDLLISWLSIAYTWRFQSFWHHSRTDQSILKTRIQHLT